MVRVISARRATAASWRAWEPARASRAAGERLQGGAGGAVRLGQARLGIGEVVGGFLALRFRPRLRR